MAGTSRDISSVMTSAANNYNTRLCWLLVARLLCELTKNRGILINKGTKNDPLIWRDRLAAIFGHTSS